MRCHTLLRQADLPWLERTAQGQDDDRTKARQNDPCSLSKAP
ncbi:MAG: hypothetical protein ABJH45_19890 [Paracoccaceae bacterium]